MFIVKTVLFHNIFTFNILCSKKKVKILFAFSVVCKKLISLFWTQFYKKISEKYKKYKTFLWFDSHRV